jgi:hypothetical protein
MADTTSQSGSSPSDMLTQLMIQLAARLISIISVNATTPIISDGHNISSPFTIVVKPVGTIKKALVAEHMTPHSIMFKTYKPMSGKDKGTNNRWLDMSNSGG